MVKMTNKKEKIITEAVEVCPYCASENTLTYWDFDKYGYIAKCWNCGKNIFLCDECFHAEDNLGRKCDWRERRMSEKFMEESCFRGKIINEREII